MGTLFVDKLDPQSGTSLELGSSGDTVSLGSGVTAGTGIGTTINNNADNRVITGSGTANTLEAESNFTFASGVVNITSSDAEPLELTRNTSNGDVNLRFKNTSGDIAFIRGVHGGHLAFLPNGNEKMRIEETGDLKINSSLTGLNSKVLIGFGATQRGMMLYDFNNGSGTTFIQFRNGSSAATLLGEITRNGSNNSINYNTTSDYRLKTNIEDKIDGIEKVKQLNVKRFNWLDNIDVDKVDGFLAHEVSSVVPEAITGEKDAVDEEGNIIPQGIDQSKLVPLLTSALQEAITKIETLEAKVAALESA